MFCYVWPLQLTCHIWWTVRLNSVCVSMHCIDRPLAVGLPGDNGPYMQWVYLQFINLKYVSVILQLYLTRFSKQHGTDEHKTKIRLWARVRAGGVYFGNWLTIYCVNSLQWRHNGLDGVWNYQRNHCLLSRLFGRRSKKTSKLRVTGHCAGNSPGTGEFPAQMASNAENVSICWRHHYWLRHDETVLTHCRLPMSVPWARFGVFIVSPDVCSTLVVVCNMT